eukprot:6184581-Pleurochrysis_carterae.AAC.4
MPVDKLIFMASGERQTSRKGAPTTKTSAKVSVRPRASASEWTHACGGGHAARVRRQKRARV